jgi:hypothetical protein
MSIVGGSATSRTAQRGWWGGASWLVGGTVVGMTLVTSLAIGQDPPADPAAPVAATTLPAGTPGPAPATGTVDPSLDRLRADVAWLAAPQREGRGPGTAGIDRAAIWLAGQLAGSGLETRVAENEPFQRFPITLDATLGPEERNRVEIVGPPGPDGAPRIRVLELGTDFTPLAAGGSGTFDLPLVFVGYGITAPAEKYDDYQAQGANAPAPEASSPEASSAGVADAAAPGGETPAPAEGFAKGAAAIVLRQEPQKDNPHSVFDGNQASRYAALTRKLANASEHEVGAVVFCNDASATEDALMKFNRAGNGADGRTMPVLHVKRAVIDEVLGAVRGTGLAAAEKAIDEQFASQSGPLTGWRIRGEVAVQRRETQARNIVAVLEGTGAGGIPATETVVVGAHYDHLGFGGSESAAPGVEAIHHGADDNASGTAMLLEVARLLAAEGPFPRRILFVAFSGEERGLLGSAHYTANPLVPLADTVAMVNLDMVGRLDGDKLIIHGTGTGSGLDGLVDRLVKTHAFDVTKDPGGFGPSDHASFYAKKIPVLHIFSGTHGDYHRPTDTAEKINYDGMVRIARLVTEAVRELATTAERPTYVEVASRMVARGGGDRPYFGSIPDFGRVAKGYAISGVAKDSPAAKGGLQGGDLIVRIGDSAVAALEDFDSALRKHKGGDTVTVVVQRDGAEVSLPVTLGDPR